VIYLDIPPNGPVEVTGLRRFRTKRLALTHEREWRSIIPKRDSYAEVINGQLMYFRAADPNDIVEVIFGHRASIDLEKQVRSMAPPGVRLRRAMKRDGTYDLEIVDI
jgi:hypothetical protein